MLRTHFILACGFTLFACSKTTSEPVAASAEEATPSLQATLENVQKDASFGEYKAQAFTNIYFGAQPSEADLETFAGEGFTTIISLRGAGEYDLAAQQGKAEALGLQYTHLPFEKGSTLSDAWIDAVTQAVVARRQTGKILVHCASGNRAGLWAGAHFHKDHGLTQADATEVGRTLGMKDAALPVLEAYFSAGPE